MIRTAVREALRRLVDIIADPWTFWITLIVILAFVSGPPQPAYPE